MSERKWKGKKYTAACIGSGMLLAALALSQDYQKNITMAEETQAEAETGVSLAIAGKEEKETEILETTEKAEDGGVKLSLADDEQDAETEAPETEAPETEAATEAVSYETLETTSTGDNGITVMDVSGIVENCMPSIVSITNKSVQEVQSYYYGSQEIESESAGSGVIIAQNDTELMIATNKHVVQDAQEITVCFSVNAEDEEDLIVPAKTKGTDGEYDLAVVAVELSDIPQEVLSQLKIATLGSSDDLKVGETAIVIGNALGVGQTVTCGIISALEREITTEAGTFTELQTDAAINFGCSGGAILNKRGEVVGITSAKATGDYAESMGYAIPIDTAIPVLTNLINRETREEVENHGYMGITVVPVSDEAKEMYNMPAGAYVYEVSSGSAAEKAGLKKGDIITKFDGITIDSSDTLVETLGYYQVGETLTLEVQEAANGEYISREVEVTLQAGTEESAEKDEADGETKDPSEKNGSRQAPDDGDMEVPSPEELYNYGNDGNSGRSDDSMEDFFNYFFGDNGYY